MKRFARLKVNDGRVDRECSPDMKNPEEEGFQQRAESSCRGRSPSGKFTSPPSRGEPLPSGRPVRPSPAPVQRPKGHGLFASRAPPATPGDYTYEHALKFWQDALGRSGARPIPFAESSGAGSGKKTAETPRVGGTGLLSPPSSRHLRSSSAPDSFKPNLPQE